MNCVKNLARKSLNKETLFLNGTDIRRLNEKAVLIFIDIQRGKIESDDEIGEEYVEKVIMYGFIVLFGSAFTFAPLIILLVCMLDLRTDAYRILWLYKRPIAYRAQDIGKLENEV